jgi:hypothetical protein
MANISIGILIADEPAPHLVEKFGNYHRMFTDLFTHVAAKCSMTVETTSYDVRKGTYPPFPIPHHALVITGSRTPRI